MNIRKKFLPKTLTDVLSMIFVVLIVPSLYWFEVFVVLPELFPPGTPKYYLHFIIGTFLMINVVGNFTYTVLCDTSTRQTIMNQTMSKEKINDGWRFCSTCESAAPPRSWHCETCGTCILKRDHHCIFTGNCVGHLNHRYFLMFIFYLFIAATYSFFYNNYFIWSRIEFKFPSTILRIIFPLAALSFGFNESTDQLYLIFYVVSLVGMLFTGALTFFHFHLVFTGCVTYERAKRNSQYSLGLKENFRLVFGKKWYFTWIMPYVNSELLHDGTFWSTSVTWEENSKNR